MSTRFEFRIQELREELNAFQNMAQSSTMSVDSKRLFRTSFSSTQRLSDIRMGTDGMSFNSSNLGAFLVDRRLPSSSTFCTETDFYAMTEDELPTPEDDELNKSKSAPTPPSPINSGCKRSKSAWNVAEISEVTIAPLMPRTAIRV